MTEFFKDIFEYNRQRNMEMIVFCMNNEQKILEKTIQLISHNLNAHHIWNQRILKQEPRYSVWDFHIINSWNSVDKHNLDDSLHIINSGMLDENVEFTDSKGNEFENIIRDILFHVINHTNYHRAQIVSNLHEAGLQPERTDYIYYKR